MNIRQQKYKKNRLLGMNKYNSARAAGYSNATATAHTKELEERIKIGDLMERKGLTDDVLIAKHKELLEAYRLLIINGEVLAVENGGIKQPELQIQIKALELAYKLKDLLKDKVEHSGEIKGNVTQIMVFNDTRKESLPIAETRISRFDTPVAAGDT
jgi:phage terminase small subunit